MQGSKIIGKQSKRKRKRERGGPKGPRGPKGPGPPLSLFLFLFSLSFFLFLFDCFPILLDPCIILQPRNSKFERWPCLDFLFLSKLVQNWKLEKPENLKSSFLETPWKTKPCPFVDLAECFRMVVLRPLYDLI